MEGYLKTYKMIIHTKSPVHIGTGKKMSKKEYILLQNKGKVLIPDISLLYQGVSEKGLGEKFTQYILANGKNTPDLNRWLRENNISSSDYREWIRYKLDCGDFLRKKGSIEINEFIKDGCGMPYVPGTSIKGMLRTVLLSYNLLEKPQSYSRERKMISNEAKSSNKGRKAYLVDEVSQLEQEVFNTLNRKDERGKTVDKKNAVNDCLSGLIVSDSEPLRLDDLILCQKIDENVEGRQRHINTLRESVRPGMDISFWLTIDTKLCDYTIDDIMKAVSVFGEAYYNVFLSKFKYSGIDRPRDDTVWIGGGTGFITKTVLYPLLGQEQGLEAAMSVFDKTVSDKLKSKHKHYNDKNVGVSPHMLKCTMYRGKKYHMGECQLKTADKG